MCYDLPPSMHSFTVPGTDVAEPLSSGSLLLMTGPSTDAKRRLALSVAASGHVAGDRALAVTTDTPPATTLRQFRTQARRAGALHAERFAIVTSATGGETDRQPPALAKAARAGRVQSFPAPTAFAALGSALSDAFAATVDTERYWLVLDSLSDVVDGTDSTTASKFCHVLGERLAETGGVGVLLLDAGHDLETVGVLRQVVDGVVRTRPADALTDGDCEFRVPAADTGWRLVDTDATRGGGGPRSRGEQLDGS